MSDGAKSFIAGGMAGVGAVLAGVLNTNKQPFDTLKVRLQTSNQYKGLLDCFRQTVAKDGILSLYRGMSAPLLGVSPMFALSFAAYDGAAALVKSFKSNKSDPLTMFEYAVAGALSAFPTTIITVPMERVKVVLQTQDQLQGGKKYKGLLDAGRGMIKEEGIRSLYRGTTATLARDAPGFAAYFVSYEFFYHKLKNTDGSVSPGAAFFAGGMAGVGMWSIAIPPDVVKSRIQAAPPGTYKGFVDCTTKLLVNEGPQALFKGLGPALLRAFPVMTVN